MRNKRNKECISNLLDSGLFVIAFLLISQSAHAKIFKCVNQEGTVFYKDQPCPVYDKETEMNAVKDPVGIPARTFYNFEKDNISENVERNREENVLSLNIDKDKDKEQQAQGMSVGTLDDKETSKLLKDNDSDNSVSDTVLPSNTIVLENPTNDLPIADGKIGKMH